MKQILFFISLQVFSNLGFTQEKRVKEMVDSLKYLTTEELGCSAAIYWRIIAQKEKAVPFLIDKLVDTTPLNVKDKCKKTRLNVSEVAYYALKEIADFPTFSVTGYQFDHMDINGCSMFHLWYFFSDSLGNKPEYQASVRKWWAKNQLRYKWVPYPKKYIGSCQQKNGIKGRFKFQ